MSAAHSLQSAHTYNAVPQLLRSVQRSCTKLLRLLHAEPHEQTLRLSSAAMELLDICTDALVPKLGYDPIPLSEAALLAARTALWSGIHLAEVLVHQQPNYYGAHRDTIALTELGFVHKYLEMWLTQIRSQPGRWAPPAAAEIIQEPAALMYWVQNFGADGTEATWDAFASQLVAQYGEHHSENIQSLRNRLVGDRVQAVVTASMFAELTRGHVGFYAAFQAVTDPHTIVYGMGALDDQVETMSTVPTIVMPLLGLHIAQVSCGGQHGAVLTASGQVWTWGRGGFGRLGHGDVEHQPVPKLVEALTNTRCVQVACGFAYTAVVSAEGELFTFGSGDNGRLGHGDRTDRRAPCRVEGLRGVFVKRVCAGSVHTCVLDDMGRVYSFGKHEYSGHGLAQDVLSPLELKGFAESGKVVDMSVGPGGYHTMVLTESGDIYTWGHNRVGQLGCSHDACDHVRNFEGAYYLPIPVRVANSREWEAVRVVAGWGHSAIITRQGQVLMCGRNLHGQLGLGDPGKFPTNERGHPYQPEFMVVQKLLHERVVAASCGGEHTVFLCANGDLYSAGTGSRGQLGHGDTDPICDPKLIAAFRKERAVIKQVSCGNNSTLMLVGRKRVPTLHEIAIDVVRHSEEAMKLLDSEENYLLPEEIVDYIRRTSSVQPFSSVHP